MAWSLRARRIFPYVAWLTLLLNVLVILGGTVVRATGSGDGCGASWPKCGQQFVPSSPAVETVIEFSHRASSFAAALAVAAVFFLALRAWPRRHAVRRAATLSAVLILVEVSLGATLVLFGWVDADVSMGRMIVVPLHLVNTFMLLGSTTVTAWWGSGFPLPRTEGKRRSIRWLWAGVAVLLVLGATGALNALADTIFPSGVGAGDVTDEFGGTAPLLLQLRIVHPIVAVIGGLMVGWIAAETAKRGSRRTRRLAAIVSSVVLVQFFIGIANVYLLAPLSMQVIHLLVADVLWISFVLFGAAWLGDPIEAKKPEGVLA